MKKILCLLMTLCLLMGLCACGGSQTGPAEDPKPAKAQSEPARPAETQAAEAQSEAAAPAEAEPETTEPETDGDALPRGQISTEGGTTRYDNPWLGFSLSMDGDWYVYSEKELAAMAGIALDLFSGSEYEQMLRSTQVFYDFAAFRSDGASINLNFTDLYGVKIPDMGAFLEQMLPSLQQVLESGNMSNVSMNVNTVSFAGAQYPGIMIEADSAQGHYYCQQIAFSVNGRLGTLTIGSYDADHTEELLALFRPLP